MSEYILLRIKLLHIMGTSLQHNENLLKKRWFLGAAVPRVPERTAQEHHV